MKNKFTRLMTMLLAVIMICGLTAPAYAATAWETYRRTIPEPGKPLDSYSNSYDDVQPGDWYYDAVMVLTEGGLFNGYGNGKFGPNDIITYGQFKTVIARMTGGRFYSDYSDSSSTNWSSEVNIVPMSRGLTVTKLVKECINGHYCCACNWDYTFTSIDDFPDSEDILNWYYEYNTSDLFPLVNGGGRPVSYSMASARREATAYVLDAYQIGLFNGVDSKGTFMPYAPLTRAQFCQILYNMGWLNADLPYFI